MTYDHFEAMKRHHKAHVKKQGKKRNIDTRSLDLLPVTTYTLNDFDKNYYVPFFRTAFDTQKKFPTKQDSRPISLGNSFFNLVEKNKDKYLDKIKDNVLKKHYMNANNQAYGIDRRRDIDSFVNERANNILDEILDEKKSNIDMGKEDVLSRNINDEYNLMRTLYFDGLGFDPSEYNNLFK